MAAVGAVVLGLLIGSFNDPSLMVEPEKRGDYTVLAGDFHAHTRMSDGFVSPFDVPLIAQREGLHVVGLTEHNWVYPGKMAAWFSDLIGGPIVVVGAELTRKDYHIILLGLTDELDWWAPLPDALDEAHAQGAVAIAAHPAKFFWPALDPVIDKLDGVELMHPIALRGETPNGWKWTSFPAFRDRAAAQGKQLTAIASSDFHFFRALGTFRTLLFVTERSSKGVVDAIREGRTVVYDLTGKAYGDPAMIALLEDAPITYPTKDRAYAHEGVLDLVGRTLAWLGLLGLIIAPRRRKHILVAAR
ncbi:MAG: putative metal-dependent phosphoesterase TrpH [Myxococcota bacterium]|jgi:predicted metal-dependent phosphoesterase TrpH